jgi:hypothetical protein
MQTHIEAVQRGLVSLRYIRELCQMEPACLEHANPCGEISLSETVECLLPDGTDDVTFRGWQLISVDEFASLMNGPQKPHKKIISS